MACSLDAQSWPLTTDAYSVDLDCIATILGVPKSSFQEIDERNTSGMYLVNYDSRLMGIIYEFDDLNEQRQNLALGQVNTVSLKANTNPSVVSL